MFWNRNHSGEWYVNTQTYPIQSEKKTACCYFSNSTFMLKKKIACVYSCNDYRMNRTRNVFRLHLVLFGFIFSNSFLLYTKWLVCGCFDVDETWEIKLFSNWKEFIEVTARWSVNRFKSHVWRRAKQESASNAQWSINIRLLLKFHPTNKI